MARVMIYLVYYRVILKTLYSPAFFLRSAGLISHQSYLFITKPKNSSRKSGASSKQTINKSQVKNMIKSMVNVDKVALRKFSDLAIVGGTLTASTPVASSLITIPIGTGASSRVGDAIDLHQLDLDMVFYVTAVQADVQPNTAFIRVIVTQAIGDDISLGPSNPLQNSSVQSYYPVAPIDYDQNKNEFHVLLDRLVSVDTYNRTAKLKANLKPRIKRTKYDTLNALWSSGQIVLNVFPLIVGTTVTVAYDRYSRLWFNDV
jgi:hypothetical protein